MIHGSIQAELMEAAAMVLATDLACAAKLHWRVTTKPEGWNENIESTQTGSEVANHELEFRALFHQVDHRLSGFQRFAEVQTGDVILDYLADLGLEDGIKEDMRIEVGGRFYIQKNAGSALKEAWDAFGDHGGMFRTLLLTPAV